MKFDKTFFQKLYHCEKRITLATVFTLLRIAFVPFIVIAMMNQQWSLAFWLFVCASFTDTIDGNLARWCHEQTVLGACLDPIADKILLVSTFCTLAFVQSPLITIPHWFVILVLCKEIIILGGSLMLLITGSGFAVKPTILGKMTTVVQISFIIWLFSCYFFNAVPIKTNYSFIGIMGAFVLISFFQYVWIGLRYLLAMVVNL